MASKNELLKIAKVETYNICFGAMVELGICDDQGKYLLSSRKNAALFAYVEILYIEQSNLLWLNLSKADLLRRICNFLQIKNPGRCNKESINYLAYEYEVKNYFKIEIEKLRGSNNHKPTFLKQKSAVNNTL